MANPLYNSMQNNQNGFLSALKSLKNNPMQFLLQRNINIPQNISSDPNAIIQHLMNTGQVSQQQYNQATQILKQFQNQG